MHELIEDVLPFLVAFFVLDGLAVVRRHETLLTAHWSRFRAVRQGFHLVGLSPYAEVISAVEWPIRFGAASLHVETSLPSPGSLPELTRVPLDGLRVEVSDRILKLGGRVVTLPSTAVAQHLAGVVRDFVGQPAPDRARRCRALLDESVDVQEVRALRATHRAFQRVLSALGLALWLLTFLVLPVGVAVRWERGPSLATVLLTGALVHASILATSWTALRRLGYSREAAATALAPIAFFPPAGAHATFVIFRDLYARFDPLVVAGVFLPAADFRALARLEVHRLRRDADEGGEVAEWAALREEAWARAFGELGTSLSEILRPPAKSDGDAASYCPLCGGEYRAGFAVCTECRVPLEALA